MRQQQRAASEGIFPTLLFVVGQNMKLNFLQIAIEKDRENLYNKKEEYFKNEKRNILC